jgi:hypothetical protein
MYSAAAKEDSTNADSKWSQNEKAKKADEAVEADELAKERRKQGNISPDLSESFSDKATFQTSAGDVCGSEEEREAVQTQFLNPLGRTAPPYSDNRSPRRNNS